MVHACRFVGSSSCALINPWIASLRTTVKLFSSDISFLNETSHNSNAVNRYILFLKYDTKKWEHSYPLLHATNMLAMAVKRSWTTFLQEAEILIFAREVDGEAMGTFERNAECVTQYLARLVNRAQIALFDRLRVLKAV